MKPGLWLPLLLFGAGLAVGLLPLHDPFWGYDFYDVVVQGSQPVDQVFASVAWNFYYRPLHLVLISSLHSLIGFSFEGFRLFNALLLGAGAVAIFDFFRRLERVHRRTGGDESVTPEEEQGADVGGHLPAALSSLFYVLSPPTMFLLWHGVEAEILAVPILYATLSLFVSLGRDAGRRSWLSLLALTGLTLAGGFLKESVRGLLPVAVAGIAFWMWRERRLTRQQWAALFAVAGAIAISLAAQVAASPEFQTPKINDPFIFLLHALWNLFQFTSPILFGGALLLFFASVPLLPGGDRALLRGALPLSLLLPLLGLMAGAPFVVISFWEALFPSDPLLVPASVFGGLVVAALVLQAWRGSPVARTCSLILLAGLAVTILGTAFSPTVRAQTTTRSFITLFPLLAWLVADGAVRLLRGRKWGRPARVAAAVCVAFLAYHVAASGFDVAQYMSASSRAQFAVNPAFGHLDLENKTVYTTRPFSITTYQIAFFNRDRPVLPAYRLPALESGFSILSDYPRFDYFHLEREKYAVPPGACEELKSRYIDWYAMSFPTWNAMAYGCPRAPLDLSLENGTTALVRAEVPFHSLPRWLEDGLYRWLRGLPFDVPSVYQAGIYVPAP